MFAGEERKSSEGHFCKEEAGQFAARCISLEWDVLRHPAHNVLVEANQQMHDWPLRMLPVDIYFNTPPCDNWCRAHFIRSSGPHPPRNQAYPLGFPWAKAAGQRRIQVANDLIFSAGALARAPFSLASGGGQKGFPPLPSNFRSSASFWMNRRRSPAHCFSAHFPTQTLASLRVLRARKSACAAGGRFSWASHFSTVKITRWPVRYKGVGRL